MRLYGLNNVLRPSTELIDYSNLLFHNIRGKSPAAWKQRLAAVKHASPHTKTTAPFGHVHKRVLIPTFKSPVSLCCCCRPPPASPAAAHLSVRAAPRLIGSVPPWTLICLPVGVAVGVGEGTGAHGGSLQLQHLRRKRMCRPSVGVSSAAVLPGALMSQVPPAAETTFCCQHLDSRGLMSELMG